MPADTITPSGSMVTLFAPRSNEQGFTGYSSLGWTVLANGDIAVVDALYHSTGITWNTLATYSSDGAAKGAGIVDDSWGGRNFTNLTLWALPNSNVLVTWNTVLSRPDPSEDGAKFGIYSDRASPVSGVVDLDQQADQPVSAVVYASGGFTLDWNYSAADGAHHATKTYDLALNSSGIQTGAGAAPAAPPSAYAFRPDGASTGFVDDFGQYTGGGQVLSQFTLPAESAGRINGISVAPLKDGEFAVVWTDGSGAWSAVYDTSTLSFGTPTQVSIGYAYSPHVVALPDGGFAADWGHGQGRQAEAFDATGVGGPLINVNADFAGVTADGRIYGIGKDSQGHYAIQYFTLAPTTNTDPPGTAHTSAIDYTAPAGITTIYLTGANQTVQANDAGDTVWSDNTANRLKGGAGADTFHLGRGGDLATGNGSGDFFMLAEIPWTGGHITDFAAGDRLDLTGLMSTTSEAGSDGFADGYLKITDTQGGAQVWARLATSGSNSTWWLTETLDGVSADQLQHTGDILTLVGSPGPFGQTYTSDNAGDHWTGTAGADTFNLGRGGDVVTGNGGNNTYKFAEVPWAGGHITDFNAGDSLDLTGLMSTTSDTGADGFAEGYLKITDDGAGNAQVWADYLLPGNDGWWLVETLDGVAPANLAHRGAVISVGSSSGGGVTPGQTFTSDNAGDHWTGTAGNDTFNLGRGGDVATGNGGNDTFKFAEAPWAGGHITDFNAGDAIGLTGLLASTGYTGSDPMADGYLKLTTDGSGNAQVWADYNLPDNHAWWLVTTLDGVPVSSLHYSNGMIT